MKNLLEQLQQLAPLAEAATAGPWTHWVDSNTVFHGKAIKNKPGSYSPADLQICQTDRMDEQFDGVEAHPIEDAAFIAAARNLLTPENLTLLVAALVSQWVAVAERMPVPAPGAASGSLTSVAVLVLLNNGKQMVGTFGSRWKEWRSEDGNTPLFDSVTHWMPLPAAPATIKGNPAHV